jgi:hypothetical protein
MLSSAQAPMAPQVSSLQSDDALRASIAERFAGAYEAQLGHLKRVADDEQRVLHSDIGALRNMAYMAQRSAAEQRSRTDDARRALGVSAQDSWELRQAIGVAQAELAVEASTLAESRAMVRHEEQASADLQQRARAEAADLAGRCEAAARYRQEEEEVASELYRALEAARSERRTEAEVATEHRARAQAAEAAREQALRGLANHEEHAMRTLKEAVQSIEADFASERADFRERDRRTLSRIQELERELDQKRQPGAARAAAQNIFRQGSPMAPMTMTIGGPPAMAAGY